MADARQIEQRDRSAGAFIRAERRNRGLTTNAAAAAIGVHRATLVRAERGERLYPGSAKLIADFYGVKVTDLWPEDPRDQERAA